VRLLTAALALMGCAMFWIVVGWLVLSMLRSHA
jgi:hypothetical protein